MHFSNFKMFNLNYPYVCQCPFLSLIENKSFMVLIHECKFHFSFPHQTPFFFLFFVILQHYDSQNLILFELSEKESKVNFWCCITDCNTFCINGFLSSSGTHICRNYAMASHPQTPIFLAPITGEGMKGPENNESSKYFMAG